MNKKHLKVGIVVFVATLFILSGFVLFNFLIYPHSANAATCSITLLWGWTDGKDYNAQQGQPGALYIGQKVTAKAQFRNCERESGQAFLDVYDIATGNAQIVTVTSSFLQLTHVMNIATTGRSYDFYASMRTVAPGPFGIEANDKFGQRSKTLVISAGQPTPTSTSTKYPTISGENACKLGATTATICWTTDIPSNTGIRYGINSPNEQSPQQYSNYTLTNHSYPLTGLQPATKYQYQAISRTSAGASPANGATHYFTTAATGTNPTPTPSENPTPSVTGGAGGETPTPEVSGGAGGSSSTTDFSLQPHGPKSFTDLLNTIITWVFNLAIPVAVIMILWSGLQMLTAGGDPGKYEKGKKTLGYAILGLAIIFVGKGFISLIKSILELSSK